MKRIAKAVTVGGALSALVGWLFWQWAPWTSITAVANLTDPAKLISLAERGANPRLLKVIYWLQHAEAKGLPARIVIFCAQEVNGTKEPRASLVKESLLRNVRIARQLGLFTPENLDRMRRGKAAMITRGPYAQSPVEVDHIVPLSLAKEAGNELANLEIMPERLNRRKSNRVGDRQIAHAQRLYQAGLLTAESLARVQEQGRRKPLRP